MTGNRNPDLDSVQIPAGGAYLWAKFWELVGADRMSYQEIAAYQNVTGCILDPLEVKTLKEMDDEYKAFVAKKASTKE